MRCVAWLMLLLPGCGGFDDFDKFLLDTAAPGGGGGAGTTDDVVDSGTDTGRTGSGGGSGGDNGGGSGSGSGGDASDPCPDADGDGVDTCSGDCDDASASTFPGAAEKEDRPSECMKDSDGDGWGDAAAVGDVVAGRDCDDDDPALTPEDLDFDGVSTCAGDCDDNDAARAPGNEEVPFDDVDSDCDGDDGGFGTSATGGGGSGYPISDYSTVASTATISTCDAVYDLTVTVDITHSWIGDLRVTLRGPSGVSVVLHSNTGSSADDIFGTYSLSGGSLTSAESLYAFVGEPGAGTWTLEVYDGAGGDTGQLDGWTLALTCL